MHIEQFEDKPLAHYSYAIRSGDEIALVDPSRDLKPYYEFAEKHKAHIKTIFETHPHADFISGHLQLHKETGADIYVSELLGAEYPHKTFDEGDEIKLGTIIFKALNTPGHSPDSISIIAIDENDEHAMFSGDTLFIGDVGRPDLREKSGNTKAKRKELAKSMYHTVQHKFNHLPDRTLVYPAHGAGSLCGKNMSKEGSSTLGKEREENWAFKNLTEDEFVASILEDQPFIPAYFSYNVDINKEGARALEEGIAKPPFHFKISTAPNDDHLIIDTRPHSEFKKNHLPKSININANSENDKFETWLGAVVKPKETFYVVIASAECRSEILHRIAKIGYEKQLAGVITLGNQGFETSKDLEISEFKAHKEDYTIIDVRNESEVKEGKIFESALAIPLHQLREAKADIPKDKPIVVHCAGGYRSAAASSLISKYTDQVAVYDLSEAVKEFQS
ncbi:MAG: MBL fold metallo-hydrolase [Winogradskyella arenosi]